MTFCFTAVSVPLHAEPKWVEFVYWDAHAQRVDLVGSFNGWRQGHNPFQRMDGDTWICRMYLDDGRYEYKFVVDGSSYIDDPRNTRMDARTGNSILQISDRVELSRNFSRPLVPHRFEIAGGVGSTASVVGEFSRWSPGRYPLARDVHTGSWRGTAYLPPGASDVAFVLDGRWQALPTEDVAQRFFFRVADPNRYVVDQGYLREPLMTNDERVTLRGRLRAPLGAPTLTLTGFLCRAYHNNHPVPAIHDESTGLITVEVSNLQQGLNTILIEAERGVERAHSAIYHILRSEPEGDVIPVILTSGEPFVNEPMTIDGSTSRARNGRILSYRWSVQGAGVSIASPGSATTTIKASRPGTFRLALEAVDEAGKRGVASINVSFRAPPSNMERVTFRIRSTDLPPGPIRTVAVAGSFNNWNKEGLILKRESSGPWEGRVWLPAGEYEYKFVVNGDVWLTDPRNSASRGAYGNSLLRVGTSSAAGNALSEGSGLSRHVRDAVMYQVMVARYCDSDGDGIGDFRGLISKLDDIRRLGINWIYLLPIFESPNLHGYGTTDYYTIKRELGTIEDFRAFLRAAHERGIRVMLDYVFYHSSADHPIFRMAAAQPESPWRSWHRWTGERTWTGYGQDNSAMPAWNLGNPSVRQYAVDVALYWLEQGVDGFRCDVAHAIPDDFWLEWTSALKARNPDVLLFPEFNEPGFDLYYDHAGTNIFEVYQGQSIDRLDDAITMTPGNGRVAVRFLNYHDKDRVLTSVGGDVSRNKLAALWLLTSPGVPMLYYGEEIGMEGLMSSNTNREMMEWDFPNAELRDHYRELIRLRRLCAALRTGTMRRVAAGDDQVYAFMRQEGQERVLVVLNFASRAVHVRIPRGVLGGRVASPIRLLGAADAELSGNDMMIRLDPVDGSVYLLE